MTEQSPHSEFHRELPQHVESEKAFLSSWMKDPPRVSVMATDAGMQSNWFHIPAHRVIFEEIVSMEADNVPFELQLFTERLYAGKKIGDAGGAAFVTELFMMMPTAANAGHYLEYIEDAWNRRELIRAGADMIEKAYDSTQPIEGILHESEARVLAISSASIKDEETPISQTVHEVESDLANADDESFFGISTGFPNLDKRIGGLGPGEMVVIAGEPSAGKTSLALNIIWHLACAGIKQKRDPKAILEPEEWFTYKTLAFTLEMRRQKYVRSLLQIGCGFNLTLLRENKANRAEHESYRDALRLLKGSQLVLKDNPHLNTKQMATIARKHKPRFIMLDYAQLAHGSKKRYETREEEIAEVSRDCKIMAEEMGATAIVISQLTNGKMRGSRAIGMDADHVWLVEETEGDPSHRTIKIPKNRYGEKGVDCEMRFVGPAQKFFPLIGK